MEDVLDVNEAAKYLHCGASTIRKLMKKNEIPYFRVAYRIFFKKELLDKWVEDQCRKNLKEAL